MTTERLARQAAATRSRVLRAAAEALRAYFRRRSFNRLRDLDDHILNDIGVTRAEIDIATRLPFSHDAGVELRRLSDDRRRGARGQRYPLERYAAARTHTPRPWL